MPRTKPPFRTQRNGSQCLHVHVDDISTVIIKREDEGVVIDVYPFKELNANPVTSTWAHNHDLSPEDQQPPSPPLTPWQRTALTSYDFGEFAYLADAKDARSLHDDLSHCGDSLLRFIFSELSAREDCTSYQDALRRMTVARNQLNDLIDDLQTMATEPARKGESPRFRLAWFIDSDATSPMAAAQEALAIQRRRSSSATLFKVRETATGKVITIDLAKQLHQ